MNHGLPGEKFQRGVVVDIAGGSEDSAVAMVGELVETQVGHHDDLVADLVTDVTDTDVEDAAGIGGSRADRVARAGHAEQHHATEPEVDGLTDSDTQRCPRMLNDTGK